MHNLSLSVCLLSIKAYFFAFYQLIVLPWLFIMNLLFMEIGKYLLRPSTFFLAFFHCARDYFNCVRCLYIFRLTILNLLLAICSNHNCFVRLGIEDFINHNCDHHYIEKRSTSWLWGLLKTKNEKWKKRTHSIRSFT